MLRILLIISLLTLCHPVQAYESEYLFSGWKEKSSEPWENALDTAYREVSWQFGEGRCTVSFHDPLTGRLMPSFDIADVPDPNRWGIKPYAVKISDRYSLILLGIWYSQNLMMCYDMTDRKFISLYGFDAVRLWPPSVYKRGNEILMLTSENIIHYDPVKGRLMYFFPIPDPPQYVPWLFVQIITIGSDLYYTHRNGHVIRYDGKGGRPETVMPPGEGVEITRYVLPVEEGVIIVDSFFNVVYVTPDIDFDTAGFTEALNPEGDEYISKVFRTSNEGEVIIETNIRFKRLHDGFFQDTKLKPVREDASLDEITSSAGNHILWKRFEYAFHYTDCRTIPMEEYDWLSWVSPAGVFVQNGHELIRIDLEDSSREVVYTHSKPYFGPAFTF